MSDKRLELTDARGTVQLQFRPADLLPLVGITWRLAWYGEGTSPLDSTEISLVPLLLTVGRQGMEVSPQTGGWPIGRHRGSPTPITPGLHDSG